MHRHGYLQKAKVKNRHQQELGNNGVLARPQETTRAGHAGPAELALCTPSKLSCGTFSLNPSGAAWLFLPHIDVFSNSGFPSSLILGLIDYPEVNDLGTHLYFCGHGHGLLLPEHSQVLTNLNCQLFRVISKDYLFLLGATNIRKHRGFMHTFR